MPLWTEARHATEKATDYGVRPTSVPCRLKLFGVALLAYCVLSTFLFADATFGQLKEVWTYKANGRQITLPIGTRIRILKIENSTVVISLTLLDGSPFITQIPSEAIASVKPQNDWTAENKATVRSTLYVTQTPKIANAAPLTPANSDYQPETLNAVAAPYISNPALSSGDDEVQQLAPQFSGTLLDLQSTLPGARFKLLSGRFYIMIRGHPVCVVYDLPMDGKVLAKSASNMIFYGPYPDERTTLTQNIIPNIVEHLGCSVFSFNFIMTGAELENKETAYWYKESGWFDAVFQARDDLLKWFNLDYNKLILIGYSGGGGMVLNIAGNFPDLIDGVAAQGANLVPNISEPNSIEWLIVNNRGEANAEVTKPFCSHLQALGCKALYCETIPERARGNYHVPSKEAFDLMYSFVAGILRQREEKQEGTDAVSRLWPYASPRDPFLRYALKKTIGLSDDDLQSNSLDFLPCADFAIDWSHVCPPMQTVMSPDQSTRFHVNFPALKKPRALIFYYDRATYLNLPRIIDDASSLAAAGYLVVSPATGVDPERYANEATSWIRSQDALQGVPIHLVGYNALGAAFLSRMSNCNLSYSSVTFIDFHESKLNDDVKSNIEQLAKECGLYSLFSIYMGHPSESISQMASDLLTNNSKERGCRAIFIQDSNYHDDITILEDPHQLEVQYGEYTRAIDMIKGLLVQNGGANR